MAGILPSPSLLIEYWSNDGSTFGPLARKGVIHDALNVGWSWYSRFPAAAFFTLRQNSVHNSQISPALDHIRIYYVNLALGLEKLVFSGRVSDPDSSGEDVVWTAWSYLAELSLSRSGYRTLYPQKPLDEIALAEWTAAKTVQYSLLNHIVTGTFERPLGSDGTTTILTDNRFGVIDVPRLLLMFDLSEIGRANTVNNVTYEISRNPPHTFNFWKNRGTHYADRQLAFPGGTRDYRFVPGYARLRNDLATIGTTAGGGAVEIIKTNTSSMTTYGRRQDVFTIKTLSGQVGGTTELDAQNAITARAVAEASQLERMIQLDVRDAEWPPFDGWEIEDTVPVAVRRGRDTINATYRIVGARGVLDGGGYHPALILQKPTA